MATLTLWVRLARWLTLSVAAGLHHRRYVGDGIYAPIGDSADTVAVGRIDTAGRYAVELDMAIRAWAHLVLAYAFTHNHSTVTAAVTGFDEGYLRHTVSARLALARW